MEKLSGKKLIVCCANGAGSSLMMKRTLEKLLNEKNITPAQIHHCAISEGKTAASNFDVVFCPRNFSKTFDAAKAKGTTIIPLKNIMSAKEMESALKEAGLLD